MLQRDCLFQTVAETFLEFNIQHTHELLKELAYNFLMAQSIWEETGFSRIFLSENAFFLDPGIFDEK
jgi:hypothetical protein